MMEIKSSQIAHPLTALTPGRILSIGLTGLVLLAGCNKQPAPQTTPPAASPQTSSTTAPNQYQSAQPGSNMAASNSAPAAAAAPRAIERPPAPPKVYTIPSGTAVTIRTGSEISAKTANVGDPFSGTLVNSLSSEGKLLFRAGAPVSGTVVAAHGQGRFKGAGDLGVTLKSIASHPVSTSTYEKSAGGKGKRSTAMIGGGAGGGALIGGLAGGGKGALIGGLLGAGAGTAGAALTGNKNISIPAESTITFTLRAPVSITSRESAADATAAPAQ
ncbi:MAG TPA: hypothetical protein VM554_03375 [Acidisarcina sp.]|nr:hypothetical protein [Acidisarcina sp.]